MLFLSAGAVVYVLTAERRVAGVAELWVGRAAGEGCDSLPLRRVVLILNLARKKFGTTIDI